jgi:pimeloyl-ACP methyl ester carboxylesterase
MPRKSRRSPLRYLVQGLLLVVTIVIAALVGFRLSALWRERVADKQLAPATGRVVETDAGDVFVQEAGPPDGMPVVLIHGAAGWSEVWRPTLAVLGGAGYRAIAVDLPPFGFSPREKGAAYRTPDQALRLTELAQALQLDSLVLVGHSVGARPAMVAAWRMPDRLRGIVLVGAALDLPPADTRPAPPKKPWLPGVLGVPFLGEALVASTVTNPMLSRWLLEQLVANPASASPEHVAMLQRPMTRAGTTAYVTTWLQQGLVDPPRTGLWDRRRYTAVERPVLLIWGAQDRITPLAQARRLQAAFTDADTAVLAGTGHLPQMEQPDQFNQALLAWLQGLGATPQRRQR